MKAFNFAEAYRFVRLFVLLVAIFTLANLLVIVIGDIIGPEEPIRIYFTFGLYFPLIDGSYMSELMYQARFFEMKELFWIAIGGALVALAFVGVFAFTSFVSKRHPIFMISAFAMYVVDYIFMMYFIFKVLDKPLLIDYVDICTHSLSLVLLAFGVYFGIRERKRLKAEQESEEACITANMIADMEGRVYSTDPANPDYAVDSDPEQ